MLLLLLDESKTRSFMSDNKTKTQRDQFLAFAFASADLLFEISEGGKINFVLGAAKSLLRKDTKELTGSDWLSLFSAYEQARILELQENTIAGMRVGPMLINLDVTLSDKKGILTGIKMPDDPKFYATLSISNELMDKIAYGDEEGFDDSLYNKSRFMDEAEQVFNFASTTNKDAELTVFEFERTSTIPEEDWAAAMGEIAQYMRSQALDGKMAGELGDNQFALVHDSAIDYKGLIKHIESLVREKDPEGKGVDVKAKSIKADVEDPHDAAKAMAYTISEIEEKGLDAEAASFSEGMEKYVVSNEDKIKELKSIIERVSFALYFQPVVKLSNFDEADHYEMLCRFDQGHSKDWFMFSEDVGLSMELDLAICERAINFINFKAAQGRTGYSMNLARSSVENPAFLESFIEQLDKDKNKNLGERLSIEIMGVDSVENTTQLKTFVNEMKGREFKITLDGVGPSCLDLLQEVEADRIKIASKYTKKMLISPQDADIVKNIAKICLDKKIDVIAKYIEKREQIDVLKQAEIEYAQGFFFGKPESKPSYLPPRD